MAQVNLKSAHVRTVGPDDIAGFHFAMRQFVDAAQELRDDPDWVELCRTVQGMLDTQQHTRQRLDDFEMSIRKVKQWYPGEPCLRRDEASVVLAISGKMITCRVFSAARVGRSIVPRTDVKRVAPSMLTKVSNEMMWDTWKAAMYRCGHSSENWTNTEIRALREVG